MTPSTAQPAQPWASQQVAPPAAQPWAPQAPAQPWVAQQPAQPWAPGGVAAAPGGVAAAPRGGSRLPRIIGILVVLAIAVVAVAMLADKSIHYAWDGVIQKMTDEQWYAMLDVHATAPFRILRAASDFIRSAAKK